MSLRSDTLRRTLLAVAFVAGLALLDLAATFALERLAAGVRTGETLGRARVALEQSDAELMLFGSSRTVHHVDPAVLEERLGLRAFNAGAAGLGIDYARGLSALLLPRSPALQVAVLGVEAPDLWREAVGRINRLAPFYGESEILDGMLRSASPAAPLKLLLGSYRYNSTLLPMLGNLLRTGRAPVGNGFEALPQLAEPDLELETATEPDPGPPLPEKLQLYRAFIRNARAHGVEVVLLESPRWRPDGLSARDRRAREIFQRLAREEGAAFVAIDEQSHPVFRDPALFHDKAHLNGDGARIFSEHVARELARLSSLTGTRERPAPR